MILDVITLKEHNMGWFNKTTLWLVSDDPPDTGMCDCPNAIVDAPWHNENMSGAGGNGWLWTCTKCGRGFTFAKCTHIRPSLLKLAKKQTPRVMNYLKDGEEISDVLLAGPSDWLQIVDRIEKKLVENRRYVFLDGEILPAKHGPVKFKGLCRSHDLPDLPHISEDLADKTIYNYEYWHPN